MIARIEYPRLEAGPYLDELDSLGREAAERVAAAPSMSADTPANADPVAYARVTALSDYLFREQRFVGNDVQYEDPRNSFLNEVLDRRTGIPITLALVYMEVARRAGVVVEGINFPGHFLVAVPGPPRADVSQPAGRLGPYRDLIIDAHHGGALLPEEACRELLRRHAGEDAVWDVHLAGRATKPQILARMLLNLKRVYVRMLRSRRRATPPSSCWRWTRQRRTSSAIAGCLRTHLNDFSGALRDLQAYLQLGSKGRLNDEEREEQAQIWEHVKSLRRRVASLN